MIAFFHSFPTACQILLFPWQDFYLVPVTTRETFGSTAVNKSIRASVLKKKLSELYDGDTVLLDNVDTVDMSDGSQLVISAGLFLQVRYHVCLSVLNQCIHRPPSNAANAAKGL